MGLGSETHMNSRNVNSGAGYGGGGSLPIGSYRYIGIINPDFGLPGMDDGRISSAATGAAKGTWGGLIRPGCCMAIGAAVASPALRSTVAPTALRFMEAKPPTPGQRREGSEAVTDNCRCCISSAMNVGRAAEGDSISVAAQPEANDKASSPSSRRRVVLSPSRSSCSKSDEGLCPTDLPPALLPPQSSRPGRSEITDVRRLWRLPGVSPVHQPAAGERKEVGPAESIDRGIPIKSALVAGRVTSPLTSRGK